MIEIWHANEPNFGFDSVGPAPAWPEGFTKVAEVDTDSFGEAFELTNHIDHPWWENKKATRIGPPARSTSVGDVAVLGGKAHRCTTFGWEEIK